MQFLILYSVISSVPKCPHIPTEATNLTTVRSDDGKDRSQSKRFHLYDEGSKMRSGREPEAVLLQAIVHI